MPSEKSLPPTKMDLSLEGRFCPPGGSGDNHTFGIDQSRNSGIGNSNKIPSVFDGTNRAEIEVVQIAGRIFPPSVVGDHTDKALFFRQISGTVGAEYGFKADNRQNGSRRVRRHKRSALLTKTIGAGVHGVAGGVSRLQYVPE